MHTFHGFTATSAMAAFAGLAVPLLLAACGSRGAAVPDLTGEPVDIMVLAALEDTTAAGTAAGAARPLMVDSIAFGRLGTLLGDAPFTAAELTAQVRRDIEPVDPEDVLTCPSRRPCHLSDGGIYVTLWDAALDGDLLTATVSRVRNVERLYLMTQHETWNVELRRTPSGWQLVSREPIV